MLKAIVFSLFIAFVASDELTKKLYTDCGKNKNIKRLTISECSDSDSACLLQKGGTYNVTVEFTSNVDVTSGKHNLGAYLGFLRLPFPNTWSDLTNPCDAKYNLNCPVKKGDTRIYKAQLPVRDQYPEEMEVGVDWIVNNQDGEEIFCFGVPAIIKKYNVGSKPGRKNATELVLFV